MYCDDGFLHAVVEELPGEAVASAGRGGASKSGIDAVTRDVDADVEVPSRRSNNGDRDDTSATDSSAKNVVDADSAKKTGSVEADGLSRRQRQKLEHKLKKKQAKQQARELKRRRESEGSAAEGSAATQQSKAAAPLRLHQFISTAFRSELNVAENGTGHFIKNAPRVSAHHAILQGVVRLNGEVCKLGITALQHGDVVSLQLEPEESRKNGELISWRGSEAAAKSLEGNAAESGKRPSRMASSADTEPTVEKYALADCEMVKFYREKLGKLWIPEIHEAAIARPLPLTLRVLKRTSALGEELTGLGFRPVTEKDVSLQVGSLDGGKTQQLSMDVMQELLRDTWILDNTYGERSESDEKRLGVFLSEARVTGELMQQELTSMIPVSVVASHLKKQKERNLHVLDLCAAPGSKTLQLMSVLERILPVGEQDGVDFTVVANELSPQRANWMRHRLHQQSGGGALSNLIVTCADGRDFAKMEPNSSFNYINAEKNKPVQKELLKVALGLLKPCNDVNGGLLVYSTCSLNPAENEEVISEVLGELNGEEGSSFQFELVCLSDDASPLDRGSGTKRGVFSKDILRVLPAKSHGGFFVAGIRKVAKASGMAKAICAENGATTNTTTHELVRQSIGPDKATISYAISPCTQKCRRDIVKTMGSGVIVSSGVAVMYEDAKCMSVLQQGCGALQSPIHQDLIRRARLSCAEMIACNETAREVVLPADRLCNTTSLDQGTPLIIEVVPGFLLPAKIVEVVQDDATTSNTVRVRILARPQVLRRALALSLRAGEVTANKKC